MHIRQLVSLVNIRCPKLKSVCPVLGAAYNVGEKEPVQLSRRGGSRDERGWHGRAPGVAGAAAPTLARYARAPPAPRISRSSESLRAVVRRSPETHLSICSDTNRKQFSLSCCTYSCPHYGECRRKRRSFSYAIIYPHVLNGARANLGLE